MIAQNDYGAGNICISGVLSGTRWLLYTGHRRRHTPLETRASSHSVFGRNRGLRHPLWPHRSWRPSFPKRPKLFSTWPARRRYLKRSSKACRPDLGTADCVSRSTVIRGFQSVQSLRASFTAILAAIGCRHCRRAPGSKKAHCVHAWSSAPHLPQRALLTSALDSSPAQRAQRLTSRHFIKFGARGPSGSSARGRGPCARGVRGVFRPSSWYPRCRYFWSDIAQSRPRSHAPVQPAPARGPLSRFLRQAVSRACLCGRSPAPGVRDDRESVANFCSCWTENRGDPKAIVQLKSRARYASRNGSFLPPTTREKPPVRQHVLYHSCLVQSFPGYRKPRGCSLAVANRSRGSIPLGGNCLGTYSSLPAK